MQHSLTDRISGIRSGAWQCCKQNLPSWS